MKKNIFFILILFLDIRLAIATPVSGDKNTPIVATAHPEATKAAIEIFKMGGNAADAAVCAAFVLAVVEPYSSGIGGGGFALTRFNKHISFLDFREVAPKKATKDMYITETDNPHPSINGILSVGVPGAVSGYLELQAKFGVLLRKDVLKRAIDIARNGFLVDEHYQKLVQKRLDVLRQDKEISRIFLVRDKQGIYQVPDLNHVIVQKDLSKTLTWIAKKGSSTFYKGKIAKLLLKDMKDRGGLIVSQDLKSYKVRYREPLVGSYRGHTIVSSPPPSSGGQIILTTLNILETLPPKPFRDPSTTHLFIEALKIAYADRALLGDPDYVDSIDRIIPDLISKKRALRLKNRINARSTSSKNIPKGLDLNIPLKNKDTSTFQTKESKDTTHLVVMDAQGNAVSMTTTVNYFWGSGVVAKGTGMIWNDEMDDFSIDQGVPNAYGIMGSKANSIAPRKTPLSSMSPTMVFQKDIKSPLMMVVGSPGGSRIPTIVLQTIVNYIDHGFNIEQAIVKGRFHQQHLPDKVSIEKSALDLVSIEILKAQGHIIDSSRDYWGNAMGIVIDIKTGHRSASADLRGIGMAMVYK